MKRSLDRTSSLKDCDNQPKKPTGHRKSPHDLSIGFDKVNGEAEEEKTPLEEPWKRAKEFKTERIKRNNPMTKAPRVLHEISGNHMASKIILAFWDGQCSWFGEQMQRIKNRFWERNQSLEHVALVYVRNSRNTGEVGEKKDLREAQKVSNWRCLVQEDEVVLEFTDA